jgi:L-ascorbate metabolism protein UlaG (beta-lactamase superfamily)
MQTMRYILILFLLAASVSACHPAYPREDYDELKPSTGGPLTARFFGVSTILLSDGNTAIMTDGFFSRPGAGKLLFGKIAPDPDRIGEALKRGGVTKLSAVLTVHSHYDHAMDAPRVARQWDAVLIGSQSTANVARGEAFPESCIRLIDRDHRRFAIGSFEITALPSLHSLGVPGGEASEGTIDAPLRPPVAYTDYKEGGTYSFLIDHQGFRIVIHASSYFVAGMYDGIEADVVFLGSATLGKKSRDFVSRYWDEVVVRTKARLVVPIHWDDFTRALDDRPLRPAPYPLEDFPRAMDMLRSLAGERVAIRFMPLYAPVDIEAAAGPPLRARPKPRPAPAPSSCP